jgi:hypothetical protein
MAISSTKYSRPEDRDILARMEDFKIKAISENQDLWAQANIDARFKAGDQSVYGELYNAPINRRNLLSFNRIRRNIDMICGNQRQNRKTFIATPQENGDQQTADQISELLLWLNAKESITDTISDAFEDALTSGISFLNVWLDYRYDSVNGDIKVRRCPVNSIIMDPFWKSYDLSDCNAMWQRSYVTPQQAASLLPNDAEEILSLAPKGSDGTFMFMPETQNYLASNLLAYDEFWYRSERKQKMLIDTVTGESMEWRSNDEEGLKLFLQQYPSVVTHDQYIPTVRLAVVVQGRVYFDDLNPLGVDSYPYVPVFGYFNPDLSALSDRFQGVVRGLRDAQYMYNRRRLIELDMLESQVTTGLIYKEDTLVDPKQAYMTGQGRAIAIKKEANIADIQQMMPPQIPPSMLQLSEALAAEIQQIAGIAEVALGMGDEVTSKSGYDTKLKQDAALAMHQGLFDRLDRSQKTLGNLILKVMQQNWTPGKVKRVLNEDPTPEFYNKNFGFYDVIIEDGYDTSTQKAMQLAQLLHLREVGIPVPDSVLIEASTLQNKQDLIDAIEQTQQAQQQQMQAQQQVEMQQLQAQANLANSRAEADRGLAAERVSKVSLNELSGLERVAEAEKDNRQAQLNYVKSLNEIEDLDISKLERLVAIAKMLEEKKDETPSSSVQQQPEQMVMR